MPSTRVTRQTFYLLIDHASIADMRSRAKMKKWFEKWLAEKARRKEKNLPAVVDYRDITYVSDSLQDRIGMIA